MAQRREEQEQEPARRTKGRGHLQEGQLTQADRVSGVEGNDGEEDRGERAGPECVSEDEEDFDEEEGHIEK